MVILILNGNGFFNHLEIRNLDITSHENLPKNHKIWIVVIILHVRMHKMSQEDKIVNQFGKFVLTKYVTAGASFESNWDYELSLLFPRYCDNKTI